MKNLQRFIENYTVSANEFKRQPVNESVLSKTIESNGKSYKAKAVYTFPISRPDQENLNGRIYTSKLWEKVIKEKQADGCFGLMDHPEDDGSTRNAWCVWRDLRFSEDKKLVIADAYLFGFWGQQVLEALEAGGSIGLSTSGWGEFKDDDKTLNEETFILERVADHVLNPSYSVFGHQEDLKTTESINESVTGGKRIDYDDDLVKVYKNGKEIYSGIEDYEPMKDADWKWDNNKKYYTYKDMIKVCLENLENSPKANKEIVMENNKANISPSIEEKSLLLNLKSMFKEAKFVENVFERIEACNSLMPYFTENIEKIGSDLKADIESQIKSDNEYIHECVVSYKELSEKATTFESKVNELEASLKESNEKLEASEAALKEANDKIDVITKENTEINEKYNESCELLDNFKIYSQKQKEITKTLEAEKNGMVTPTQYKESIVYSQSLEEEIKELKAQLHEAKKSKKEDDEEPVDNSNDDASDKDDVDSDDDDDIERIDDKKKNESFFNEDIRLYYEDLEDMNPRVSCIKEDIAKCRTLLEAQMTYLRLKGLCGETDQAYYESAAKNNDRKLDEKEIASYERKSILREGWL